MDEIFIAPSLLCHCKELEMYIHILIDDIFLTENSIYSNICINNGNFESLTPRSLIESPHRHVDPSGYSSAQCGPRASDTHTTKVPGRRPLALGSRRVLPHGHTSRTYAYSTCTPCRVSTYTGSPASSHMRAELHFPSVPFRSYTSYH